MLKIVHKTNVFTFVAQVFYRFCTSVGYTIPRAPFGPSAHIIDIIDQYYPAICLSEIPDYLENTVNVSIIIPVINRKFLPASSFRRFHHGPIQLL